MYTTTQASNINGMGIVDAGSGTIDPAALNAPINVLPNPSLPSPRGTKRSRSPESQGDAHSAQIDDDEARRRKRGRPTKATKLSLGGSSTDSPGLRTPTQPTPGSAPLSTPGTAQPFTPGQASATSAPAQTSPPRATPSKSTIKALPTVRDHTTDQLTPEKDEYEARERDEAGDRKVSATGVLHGERVYKCRTFTVPGRGEKRYMLATECARVLGYRDSYLLFNKNRSLYKIIAAQAEKDHLIAHEILPYSYRSRQIAIVTARSMFRQFGARVVVDGRRVRDDYWEAKARKQGFTEEDLAGEKRPGGGRAARDAQAAADAVAAATYGSSHHLPSDVTYTDGPSFAPGDQGSLMPGGAAPVPPLPMIHPLDDARLRDYGGIPRPRQDLAAAPAPYIDRTSSAGHADLMQQSSHAASFSAVVNEQARARSRMYNDFYAKPRSLAAAPESQGQAQQPQDQPSPGGHQQQPDQPQPQEQPQQQQQPPSSASFTAAGMSGAMLAPSPQHQQPQHPGMLPHHAQAGHPMGYAGYAPSAQHRALQPQLHPHAPSPQHHPQHAQALPQHRDGSGGMPGSYGRPPPGYGYQPQQQPSPQQQQQSGQAGQMWGAPPPAPSPLQQAHLPPQYGRPAPHPTQSPRGQPQHHPPPPQSPVGGGVGASPPGTLQGSAPGVGSPAMPPSLAAAYGGMPGVGAAATAYGQQQRGAYGQAAAGQRSPFMGGTSGAGGGAAGQQQQWQQGWQQY